ncbi:MAG: T9SS type A sorting domain-containing protein [Paludibacteraceae bacterium]|nr:T9SS type A sorting domain-containing protein [Paludibacteraceae bacterium]
MKKTLITLFSFFTLYGANAGTLLTVEYLDGKSAQEQLAKLSKIEFDSKGNMTFNYNNGSTKDMGNVLNTQKIVFTEGEWTSAKQAAATQVVRIYPNPTTETIGIVGKESDQVVKIYSTTGCLVQTSNESNINVSKLPNGEYFVVIGQTVAKMVKK